MLEILNISKYSFCLHIIAAINFLIYVWPLILFKILIQICKIISHVPIFLSDKTNYNKIYNIFLK
jgi:hypothetical protein